MQNNLDFRINTEENKDNIEIIPDFLDNLKYYIQVEENKNSEEISKEFIENLRNIVFTNLIYKDIIETNNIRKNSEIKKMLNNYISRKQSSQHQINPAIDYAAIEQQKKINKDKTIKNVKKLLYNSYNLNSSINNETILDNIFNNLSDEDVKGIAITINLYDDIMRWLNRDINERYLDESAIPLQKEEKYSYCYDLYNKFNTKIYSYYLVNDAYDAITKINEKEIVDESIKTSAYIDYNNIKYNEMNCCCFCQKSYEPKYHIICNRCFSNTCIYCFSFRFSIKVNNSICKCNNMLATSFISKYRLLPEDVLYKVYYEYFSDALEDLDEYWPKIGYTEQVNRYPFEDYNMNISEYFNSKYIEQIKYWIAKFGTRSYDISPDNILIENTGYNMKFYKNLPFLKNFRSRAVKICGTCDEIILNDNHKCLQIDIVAKQENDRLRTEYINVYNNTRRDSNRDEKLATLSHYVFCPFEFCRKRISKGSGCGIVCCEKCGTKFDYIKMDIVNGESLHVPGTIKIFDPNCDKYHVPINNYENILSKPGESIVANYVRNNKIDKITCLKKLSSILLNYGYIDFTQKKFFLYKFFTIMINNQGNIFSKYEWLNHIITYLSNFKMSYYNENYDLTDLQASDTVNPNKYIINGEFNAPVYDELDMLYYLIANCKEICKLYNMNINYNSKVIKIDLDMHKNKIKDIYEFVYIFNIGLGIKDQLLNLSTFIKTGTIYLNNMKILYPYGIESNTIDENHFNSLIDIFTITNTDECTALYKYNIKKKSNIQNPIIIRDKEDNMTTIRQLLNCNIAYDNKFKEIKLTNYDKCVICRVLNQYKLNVLIRYTSKLKPNEKLEDMPIYKQICLNFFLTDYAIYILLKLKFNLINNNIIVEYINYNKIFLYAISTCILLFNVYSNHIKLKIKNNWAGYDGNDLRTNIYDINTNFTNTNNVYNISNIELTNDVNENAIYEIKNIENIDTNIEDYINLIRYTPHADC